jgi:hypothetical protein
MCGCTLVDTRWRKLDAWGGNLQSPLRFLYTGSGTHPIGTGGSFPEGKAAGPWIWGLKPNQFRGSGIHWSSYMVCDYYWEPELSNLQHVAKLANATAPIQLLQPTRTAPLKLVTVQFSDAFICTVPLSSVCWTQPPQCTICKWPIDRLTDWPT